MPKPMNEEVQVLRFFEHEPLERAEAVFNIVHEKMRERTRQERGGDAAGDGTARRRRRRNQEAGSAVSDPPQET